MQVIIFLLLFTFISVSRTQSFYNCTNITTCSECYAEKENCCWNSSNCITKLLSCNVVVIPCYEENALSPQFYIVSAIAFAITIVLSIIIRVYTKTESSSIKGKCEEKRDFTPRQKKATYLVLFLLIWPLLWLVVIVYLETFKKDNEFIQRMGSCMKVVGISALYVFLFFTIMAYTLRYIGVVFVPGITFKATYRRPDGTEYVQYEGLPSYFAKLFWVLGCPFLICFIWATIIIIGTFANLTQICPL